MPRPPVPDDLPQVTQVDYLPAVSAFMEMIALVGVVFPMPLANDGRTEIRQLCHC
jgi:hypothetical protein